MNKHTYIATLPPNGTLLTSGQWRKVADKFRWTNLDFKPYRDPKPGTARKPSR